MKKVVLDIFKALGDINVKDIDQALKKIPRPQDLTYWDAQIANLMKEQVDLKA